MTKTISLKITREPPSWLSARAQRELLELLEEVLGRASVEGVVQVAFGHQQNVLKRRPVALSVAFPACHRGNSPHAVAVLLAGRDARNDQCEAVLTMPAGEAEKFRGFMMADPLYVKGDGVAAAGTGDFVMDAAGAGAGAVDQDSLALFLDCLKEHGGMVTRATAKALAARQFGEVAGILEECIIGGWVKVEGEICRVSTKGESMLEAALKPAPAAVPVPSRFEVLREAVQVCRRELEALQAAHEATALERTRLTLEVEQARKQEKEAGKQLERCRARLEEAEKDHGRRRAEVLQAEAAMRDLGPDEAAAREVAQRKLTEAEREYAKFVEI